MIVNVLGSGQMPFINCRHVSVAGMPYLTNNVGFNLNCNCQNSVMVGQGINQVDVYSEWFCVALAGCLCNLPAVRVLVDGSTS